MLEFTIAVAIWIGLGGFAFGYGMQVKHATGTPLKDGEAATWLVGALLIGPFAFGSEIGEAIAKHHNAQKESVK